MSAVETISGDWDGEDYQGREVGVTLVRFGFDGNEQTVRLFKGGRQVLELSPENAGWLSDELRAAIELVV